MKRKKKKALVSTPRRKSTTNNEPAKRTIESDADRFYMAKYKWNDGVSSARFYEIGPRYKIKALRGKIVQFFKKVNVDKYAGKLLCKAKGGWMPGDVIKVRVKDIIDNYPDD